MTKRRELERHLHGLGEIRDIMNAMKNLALMETHKLTRVLTTQRRAVATIRSAGLDFLSFHRDLAPEDGDAREVYVFLGSERGFCGDFNESLLQATASARIRNADNPALILVGGRLASKLDDDSRVVARLSGPTVLEEVEPVLLVLMNTLQKWHLAQSAPRPLSLTVFHHRPDASGISASRLRPFGEREDPASSFGHPPLLNVEPRAFLASLVEHYLFAVLHEIFYSSLMAENRQRMRHMEAAVRHIERESQELRRKRNVLRQEEITEEIEVILLSVGTPR